MPKGKTTTPGAWSLVVREVLREFRLSQKGLASLCGCDPKTVSRWASEEVREPYGFERIVVLVLARRLASIRREAKNPEEGEKEVAFFCERVRQLAETGGGMERIVAFAIHRPGETIAQPVEIVSPPKPPSRQAKMYVGLSRIDDNGEGLDSE